MGTIIKATGISVDRSEKSSIAHAAAAAKDCLRTAGIGAEDVDVLINIGVYRDSNMVEPSMAALIQRELGLNLDYVKYPTKKTAFSFDLMNGACGLLNAIQVGGSFLTAGKAEYVLIVSSDTHPSNEKVEGFPYASVGAAMLLARAERESQGFGQVRVRESSDDFVGREGFQSCVEPNGRRRITIKDEEGFADRALDLAARVARDYATAEGLDLGKTLLVTSQLTPDFAPRLAERLAVSRDQAAHVGGLDGDPHSSALTFAYHASLANGRAASFDQMLFVAAGAGLTSACAVYRK